MNDKEKIVKEEMATTIYHTLTTRVTFILPEGTTLLGFSEQLADQISPTFKKHGGVYLSDNQELPMWQARHLAVDVFSYDSGQQDMVNDRFRRVIEIKEVE